MDALQHQPMRVEVTCTDRPASDQLSKIFDSSFEQPWPVRWIELTKVCHEPQRNTLIWLMMLSQGGNDCLRPKSRNAEWKLHSGDQARTERVCRPVLHPTRKCQSIGKPLFFSSAEKETFI